MKSTFRAVAVPAALVFLARGPSVVAGQEARPVGSIDFFGQKGLDEGAARSALAIRKGQVVAIEERAKVRAEISDRVRQAVGHEPTDVTFVCCEHGARSVFIGLPGESSQRVTYHPAPAGASRFPPTILRLRDDLERALKDGVFRGNAEEDDSAGFALATDPAARSMQMKLREYALRNESTILDVLEHASDAEQRSFAATALGYASQSPRQIGALVRASFDPADDVRNNAVRALSTLVFGIPAVARDIPVDGFISLLRSRTWSDRNKSIGLFLGLTATRDDALLAKLRAEALDALLEMGRWSSKGHAMAARIVLARIAGFDDKQLGLALSTGDGDEILEAFAPR